jgi:cytochrome c oxidase subunit 1
MTTHGTMLVFFGIVPLLFSGFGNYVIPVASGSEMCFPRINFTGLILFYLGSGFLVVSLIARSQATLAMAMALNISSSMICSVNFVATILRLHRSGMNWNKMSFMVLTVFATAILLFINFVPLAAAAIMQLSSDFQGLDTPPSPSRILSYQPVSVFWHHVLWFTGHPEVYILLLFILGLMVEGFKSLFKKLTLTT